MIRRPTAVYLDQGLRLWILNTAKKNFWRVAKHYELTDLIQDGYLCYAICLRRYGQTCDGPSHFMSLVKTTYRNFITDLANKRSASESVEEIQVSQLNRKREISDQDLLERIGKDKVTAEGDAELVSSLSGASAEIKTLMHALTTETTPAKLLNSSRLTTNETLNALIGTVGHDFEHQLRELLGLPVTECRGSLGFTYDGYLDEVKRAALVSASNRLAPHDRRKVYKVQSYDFRFLPAQT